MPQPIRASDLTPGYRYNDVAKRYIDANGKFVSSGTIRGALDDTILASRDNVDILSRQLINREISLSQWQTSMAQEIKVSQMASAAAGKGGWAQMSQSDYGFAGQRIRAQYQYLNKFAQDIASGKQPLNGNLIRRARMYIDASRGTYEAVREREYVKARFGEYRRVRAARDSCIDCIRFEALSWKPIGTLPPIGSSQCKTNCKCSFEYRKASGEISQ